LIRFVKVEFVLGFGIGSDSLLRTYNYYSRIINARLASGYLTNRPTLYAAQRLIRVGQGFSRDDLIASLRRAGYIETSASDVWSGSFSERASAIDISPSQRNMPPRTLTIHV